MQSFSPIKDLSTTVYMSPQDHAVRYFALVTPESERRYYEELARHIRNSKEAVYRLGRGFSQESRSSLYEEVIGAEREALRNGVEMIRIQLGVPVASAWAESYATLLDSNPDRFRVFGDLDNTLPSDICLIDPRGHAPIVNFVFEASELTSQGSVSRPIVAIFIMNARDLATSLANQLIKQTNELPRLTSTDVRNLARKYVYFGWGVHMAARKMKNDVPGAIRLGKATLHGWRREIKGILAGPADRATIKETENDNDSFEGVAYELSWWEKALLDRLERRAYKEVSVKIQLDGKSTTAFTYIPLPSVQDKTQLTPDSWIQLVIEGAAENQMKQLLAELRSAGLVPPDDLPRGTL